MLRVCVIGMGPIGNRHCRIYKKEPLGPSSASVTSGKTAPRLGGVDLRGPLLT
jgi:hypothetical protein